MVGFILCFSLVSLMLLYVKQTKHPIYLSSRMLIIIQKLKIYSLLVFINFPNKIKYFMNPKRVVITLELKNNVSVV